MKFEKLSSGVLVKDNDKIVAILTDSEYKEYLDSNKDPKYIEKKEHEYKEKVLKELLQGEDDIEIEVNYNEESDSYEIIDSGNLIYTIDSSKVNEIIQKESKNTNLSSNANNISDYSYNESTDNYQNKPKYKNVQIEAIKFDENEYNSLCESLKSNADSLSSIAEQLNSAGGQLTGIDGHDFGVCAEAASVLSVAGLCTSFAGLIEYSINTFKECDKNLSYYFDNYILDDIFKENGLLGYKTFDKGTKAIDIYRDIYNESLSQFNEDGDYSKLTGKIQSELEEYGDIINKYENDVNKWLYGVFTGDYSESVNGEELITIEEFQQRVNESNAMFKDLRSDAVNEFLSALKDNCLIYQSEAVPTSLNVMLENIFKNTYQDIIKNPAGTEEYNRELELFKNDFASNILSKYNDYSSLPEDLLDSCENDYEKALILLSFDNSVDNMKENFNNAILPYTNDEYYVESNQYYDNVFNLFEQGKTVFDSTNFDGMNLKETIKKYQSMLDIMANNPELGVVSGIGYVNPNWLDLSVDKQQAWLATLEKFGYVTETVDEETKKALYENTFNDDFFTKIVYENGQNGLYDFLNDYYANLGLDDDLRADQIDQLFGTSFSSYLVYRNCDNHLLDSLAKPLEKLCNDKITLDASEANYKMYLASIVDTSDVTKDDIEIAREYYGNDYDYLDDWQLKVTALAMKKDIDIFKSELSNSGLLVNLDYSLADFFMDDVFYDIIAQKKGYEKAINVMNLSVSPNDSILRNTFSAFSTVIIGIGDGVYDSVRNAVNLVAADGKMDSEDYYQQYLQQFLSTDYSLFRKYEEHDGEVIKLLHGPLEILSNYVDENGKKIFTEREIARAKENNAKIYELLFMKDLITQEDYLNYKNLEYHIDNGDAYFFSQYADKNTRMRIADVTHNVASSVGNMMIPMALSAFVSPVAMDAWIFASSAGSERERLLLSGKDNDLRTFGQAAAKGILAVTSERLLGALAGYGAKSDEILGVFKNYEKYPGFLKFLAKTASNDLNEVKEELFENYAGYLIDSLFGDNIPTGGEILLDTYQTALYTALSTPFINAAGDYMLSLPFSYVNRYRLNSYAGGYAKYSINEYQKFNGKNGFDFAGFTDYLKSNYRFDNNKLINEILSNSMINENNCLFSDTNVLDILRSMNFKSMSPQDIFNYKNGDYFDYESLLNYYLLNFKYSEEDINTLGDLSDVRNIISNPESLDLMQRKINELLMAISGKDVDIESVLNNSEYKYLEFLAYYVSRDRDFRVAHEDILEDIAYNLSTIGEKYIESKKNPDIDYNGIKISLYGDDAVFLEKSLQRLLETIDKMPEELRKQINGVKIYDEFDPGNLAALYKYKKILNDNDAKYFRSAADHNERTNVIRFFKNIFYRQDFELLNTMNHESSHALDSHLGAWGKFSEKCNLWSNAIANDNKSVSEYGDVAIYEDFAEFGALYAKSLLEGELAVRELFTQYPERTRIMKALFDLQNPSKLSLDRRIEVIDTFAHTFAVNRTDMVRDMMYGYYELSPMDKEIIIDRMPNAITRGVAFDELFNDNYLSQLSSMSYDEKNNLYNSFQNANEKNEILKKIVYSSGGLDNQFYLEIQNIADNLPDGSDKNCIIKVMNEQTTNSFVDDISSISDSNLKSAIIDLMFKHLKQKE